MVVDYSFVKNKTISSEGLRHILYYSALHTLSKRVLNEADPVFLRLNDGFMMIWFANPVVLFKMGKKLFRILPT